MLFELGLTNFKPFRDEQVAQLRPITLIYGPNSGGKSSVIQALMLLKQTLEGAAETTTGLIPRGSLVDLGSFKALVHRHDLDRALGLRFAFDPVRARERTALGTLVPRDFNRTVELSYRSASSPGSRKRDSSELASTRYGLEDGDVQLLDLRLCRATASPAQETLFAPLDAKGQVGVFALKDDAARQSLVSYFLDFERRTNARRRERERAPVEDLPEPAELTAMLEDAVVFVDGGIPARLLPHRRGDRAMPLLFRGPRYRVIDGIAREFTRLVASLSYLGPLRSYPERHYVVHGGTPASVGKSGEFTPQILYRRQKALTSQVNGWFGRFDIPYQLNIKELDDDKVTGTIIVMSLEDRRTRVTVAPSDVGFGIGQLLPILVEGLVAEGRIICVEQPEIHLHPRLQAHLADFFVETSGAGVSDEKRRGTANQWIVETHSEALILRIQKHIRAGRLSADNISVLYVQPGAQGSMIQRLRLDEDGEFVDAWPDGFFEERFDDIFGATR